MNDAFRLTLSNDVLYARIAPQLGGRLTHLRTVANGTDLIVPLDRWEAPAHGWPKAGAYPLIPYSNRIAGARLRFDGATHDLPPHPLDLPNALHGNSHLCAWEVESHDATHAILTLHYDGEHWPWAFDASLGYRLDGATLHVDLSVRNADTRPMPAGLGWHPFLVADDHAGIRFDASTHWQLDDKFVPTGARQQQSAPTELGAADWQTADCVIYASEWTGPAIVSRHSGHLAMHADAPLTHLIAFVPRGAPYLCVEPVSHVANGFNLAAQGETETGMLVLGPGESAQATTRLQWVAAPRP
ncbi:aldose 1-epimerase [Pandoraea fibrosis]|uniref:Aldose 1-epimerase n=1 Tax=Pandoraea fibrosis TaxID=1891094 RepID=A0ABX6HSS7_9BURK|nr:aldose 1-epimerase [Pandoraea fibrosis]QHE92541.1 aldose 1-epimerase [Pandoraea fibrosis]QHF13903.1 aldose 1-epimerase [Pandoraea fibrosis]